MKTILTFLFLFAGISFTSAQTKDAPMGGNDSPVSATTKPATLGGEAVVQFAEVMPEFPGGPEALMSFLHKNLKYPEMARENGVTGSVYASFIVSKEGKISDIKIVKGLGAGCNEEVLRVLKFMPDWKPGMMAGKPVAVQFNLPVKFKLADDEPVKKEEIKK